MGILVGFLELDDLDVHPPASNQVDNVPQHSTREMIK